MRKLTKTLLWMFVFSLPWEFVASETALGTVSRAIGAAAIAAAAAAVVVEGRCRRPGAIVGLTFAFVGVNTISLFWTISAGASIERVWTYAQLLVLVWIVWEFVRRRDDQTQLFLAYCLGAFVSLADLMSNYAAGHQAKWDSFRFSATGYNANEFSLVLVLGIPMAWQLMLTRRGVRRAAAATYIPLAMTGVLLTGSRGGFLACTVALAAIASSAARDSVRAAVLSGALVVAAGVAIMTFVPAKAWDRIAAMKQEVDGEMSLTGRVDIWKAGFAVFEQNPTLGIGTGAFQDAVAPLLPSRATKSKAPHNVALAILVEQGIFGFVVFALLLAACAWCVTRIRGLDRKVWTALALAWLVGSMSMNIYYRKTTWLLIGLAGSRAAIEREE